MLCIKVLVEIAFLQNLVLLNFYTFLNVLNVRDFIMVSISILLTRRLIFSDLVLLRSNCPCFYWIINICLLVNHLFLQMLVGIPGGAVVKSPPARAGDARDAGSVLGLGRSPGGDLQPTPVFLPGKFHRQRSLVGCSPWGRTESDTTKHVRTRTHPRTCTPRHLYCSWDVLYRFWTLILCQLYVLQVSSPNLYLVSLTFFMLPF